LKIRSVYYTTDNLLLSIGRKRGDLAGGHKECPVLSSKRDIFEFLLFLCQYVGGGREGIVEWDGLSFFGGKLAFGGH
jgi:hypothetical protein